MNNNNESGLSPCSLLCQDCAYFDVCDFPYMCADSSESCIQCDTCNFGCPDYTPSFEIPF